MYIYLARIVRSIASVYHAIIEIFFKMISVQSYNFHNTESVWKQEKPQNPLNMISVKKQEKQPNPLNMESALKQENIRILT